MIRTVLVDDVADIRTLVRRWLTQSGSFAVVGEAGTGTAGVELAMAEQPDLLLLDLSMPEMDGLEALPLIRAAAPDTAVVVLTGFVRDDIAAAATAGGAVACLSKSLSGAELTETLLRVVATARA